MTLRFLAMRMSHMRSSFLESRRCPRTMIIHLAAHLYPLNVPTSEDVTGKMSFPVATVFDVGDEPVVLQNTDFIPNSQRDRQREEPGYVAAQSFRSDGQVTLHGVEDHVQVLNDEVDEDFLLLRHWLLRRIRRKLQDTSYSRIAEEFLPYVTVTLRQRDEIGDAPSFGFGVK